MLLQIYFPDVSNCKYQTWKEKRVSGRVRALKIESMLQRIYLINTLKLDYLAVKLQTMRPKEAVVLAQIDLASYGVHSLS